MVAPSASSVRRFAETVDRCSARPAADIAWLRFEGFDPAKVVAEEFETSGFSPRGPARE